jgi:hypothetical protein
MDPERKGEPQFEPVRSLSLVVLLALRDGVQKEMPAFKDELQPEHLDAIIALIRKLAGP